MTTYTYIRKTFTHHGRRYEVTGKTEKEAMRKLLDKRAALEHEDALRRGGMLLKDWCEEAIDTYKPNVSQSTSEQIRLRLRKHLISELGNIQIEQITPRDIQKIMNKQKGMSQNHIDKLTQNIYFVFDCARKNGMISKNPAEDLVRPVGSRHQRRGLTAEEREHFLRIADTDPRFMLFKLMLFCGCRPAEAASVRFEDVTEREGVYFLHIRGTKTARADRLVPIPKEMHADLIKRDSRGFCAVNQAGKPFDKTSYKRLVKTLRRQMNLSMGAKTYRNELIPPLPLADDFTPYLFRHTFCTDLKKKGVDVRIASEFMGHASIRTTADIYDHSDDDTLMLGAKQMGLC